MTLLTSILDKSLKEVKNADNLQLSMRIKLGMRDNSCFSMKGLRSSKMRQSCALLCEGALPHGCTVGLLCDHSIYQALDTLVVEIE